jgi:addiction module RelE/StbE family toxin
MLVVLTRRALKDFDRLSEKHKERVLSRVGDLKIKPFLGKKLKGEYTGAYSLRAWPYRIFYKVDKEKDKIKIVKISHRQDAY